MPFYVSKSHEDTKDIAAEFLLTLKPNGGQASVVGLSGDLGAGKTKFTQLASEVLNIPEHVTSPTFVILKLYDIPSEDIDFNKLIHIDAYRLNSGQELLSLGWEEALSDPTNLIFIEWFRNVKDILPEDMTTVLLDPINRYTRNIEIIYGNKE